MIFPLPQIEATRPLYLYGAGMMGVSYKRQIEQRGMLHLLQGFIEDQPSTERYLGVPVIKRSDLTARQVTESQFLIASSRLGHVFEENLIAQGCAKESIVYPAALAWNGRSVIDAVKHDQRVCIYPVISNRDDLRLIGGKVRKKNMLLARNGVKVRVTVVVEASANLDMTDYAGVELIRIGSEEPYPHALLQQTDAILIFNGSDLSRLDVAYHDKVYFYGISVLSSFASRVKRYLAVSQPVKHAQLIEKLKGKRRLRVAFLALHASVWKVDAVFTKMLNSPSFDPLIVVCPYVSFGEERMWADMRQSCEYFEGKGYPFICSYDAAEQRWLNLTELGIDIVFFTNPHNLTRKEYYQEAYLGFLSCYVPYHHEVCRYGGDHAQYNQDFHNALWKIFVPHRYSFNTFKAVSVARGTNVIVTGYPAMEGLLEKKARGVNVDAWKTNDGRYRVIWAPHHTIDNAVLPYSNFLKYAQAFRSAADIMKDQVVWSFKPHPLLKPKLYKHASWGREKTDEYYAYWATQPHAQLDEGEYIDLFLSADAMIHDSGSFLAEFLYVQKPVLYLYSENNQDDYYSGFGLAALDACEIGHCFDDVMAFLGRLIESTWQLKDAHGSFLAKEIMPYFENELPSQKILNEIGQLVS